MKSELSISVITIDAIASDYTCNFYIDSAEKLFETYVYTIFWILCLVLSPIPPVILESFSYILFVILSTSSAYIDELIVTSYNNDKFKVAVASYDISDIDEFLTPDIIRDVFASWPAFVSYPYLFNTDCYIYVISALS